jgi:hypothetical protein
MAMETIADFAPRVAKQKWPAEFKPALSCTALSSEGTRGLE